MVVRRSKKAGRYRGHTTYGGGSRKKRRGAGSRGGRGLAGTGKKSGHKKILHVLGQTGFISKRRAPKTVAVNVGYFTSDTVAKLVEQGKAVKQGSVFTINLEQLGYGKLLGTGKTSVKLKLVVAQWSAQAEEKIKAAGGSVVSSEGTAESASEE